MICLNCKKQIPDNSASCPYCGNQIVHKEQLPEEIRFRRYQRWFFYVLISIVFLGMLGVIIKIYDANSKYIASINEVKKKNETQAEDLAKKEEVIKAIQADLQKKQEEVSSNSAELEKAKADLTQKTEDYKKALDEKIAISAEQKKCEIDLTSSDANIYSLIIKLGMGVTNHDLLRIPIADANFYGLDTDNDGLPDAIEESFATDKTKPDTDGDGFGDKQEIFGGYNPKGSGNLPIDTNFANSQKGRILLQVEDKGEAWYVSPGDGRRYFLGTPVDAFRIMRDLDYWTKDWKEQVQTGSSEGNANIENQQEEIVEPSMPATPNQRIGETLNTDTASSTK